MQIIEYNILIVDDEEDIIAVLKKIISKAFNYNIATAGSFHQAKLVLENFRPNIAFIDINLGDGNGLDILKMLTENPQKNLDIIMMSAYATESEISDALKKASFTFLQKPFTKDSVLNCLHTITKASQ